MNLIKVNQTEKGMTVDGRELHAFLEVGRDFTNWIKDRIEKYGFIQGEDFSPESAKTSESGGRPRTEYELSIDMKSPTSDIRDVSRPSYRQWGKLDIVTGRAGVLYFHSHPSIGNYLG
ncbi:antA/AntB antirepressor family protein [Paenibacillus sp. MZ04-78.2]|uniref:antA/AntB antirepressor family protein n=1 Tax=Paenibacillus sp. MZ04-78.2 TaxID=2962034 RepID=UPI0020B6FC19|nr:antA/AntB antirepressor family protein [Paenibacillus sp. MZ04-78.2]MCP3775223.1 antA/AntB antirepressor family protein [Paenibacillus sp. MZ04-78.2]